MPARIHELPDDLDWLTPVVEDLVRPAAFLKKHATDNAPRGGTRAWGLPDVAEDTRWHQGLWHSPYDGESFWLQLNLAEIPAAVRKPEWPTEGVVWVTIDLSGDWAGKAYFDPRPAELIPWRPRLSAVPPKAAEWRLADTVPGYTEEVLPQLAPDFRSAHSLTEQYDDWACTHYVARRPSDIQVGGWIWPCQGEFEERNATFVLGMERQEFGDHGAVYLHYSPDRGFFVMVETH